MIRERMSTDNNAKFNTTFDAEHADEQPLDLSRRKKDKNIIKQSLKSLIQTRRLAEGKELLSVTFSKQEPVAHELTPEELQKQHERKEQNRKAAHKCRQKRKHKLESFIMEKEKEEKRKKWLENTLYSLEKEKTELLKYLRTDQNSFHGNIELSEREKRNVAKNSPVISNVCLEQKSRLHISGECGNQNKCDQKKFNEIKPAHIEHKHSQVLDQHHTDDRIAFLNYYMNTSPNTDNCSNKTDGMFAKVKDESIEYHSDFEDSDSDSSEGLLVIYSDTDSCDTYTGDSQSSCDMYNNSQQSSDMYTNSQSSSDLLTNSQSSSDMYTNSQSSSDVYNNSQSS